MLKENTIFMNVRSPNKGIKYLKYRNQDSLFLPQYFLGNSIPKHNIGTFNINQPEVKLMSRMPSMINEDDFNIHNIQSPYDLYPPDFNDDISDPFNLFSADLFDDLEQNTSPENLVDEQPILNTNEEVSVPAPENKSQLEAVNNLDVQSDITNTNGNKISVQTEKTSAIGSKDEVPNEKIKSHILTPIFGEWIDSFQDDGTRYRRKAIAQIKSLIKFFVDEKIDRPTTDDALRYIRNVFLKEDNSIQTKRAYKSAINNFFAWTSKCKKYDNIMSDIVLTVCRDEKTGKAYLKASDKRTKRTRVQLSDSLTILMNALELRLKNLDAKFSGSYYRYEISNFVVFCNMNTIKEPHKMDLVNYCIGSAHKNDDCINILNDFFTWTAENDIYENLAEDIKGANMPVRKFVDSTRVSRNATQIQGTNTPIDIAFRAGFYHSNIQVLMKNDLVVFRDWLATSPGSSDVQTHVLNFAHFLYLNRITTPTQQTLIDYYNLYLLKQCPSLASVYLSHIKSFFVWADRENIYPNIAINIGIFRKDFSDTDCPILIANQKRKPIPIATKPLIVFH